MQCASLDTLVSLVFLLYLSVDIQTNRNTKCKQVELGDQLVHPWILCQQPGLPSACVVVARPQSNGRSCLPVHCPLVSDKPMTARMAAVRISRDGGISSTWWKVVGRGFGWNAATNWNSGKGHNWRVLKANPYSIFFIFLHFIFLFSHSNIQRGKRDIIKKVPNKMLFKDTAKSQNLLESNVLSNNVTTYNSNFHFKWKLL